MPYEELEYSEGKKYFPHVRNLFFMPLDKGGFFVEPWENRGLRACAEFQPGNEMSADELLAFIADEELLAFLKGVEEFYIFGAYNQINVCQMRARATATFEQAYPGEKEIRERLRMTVQKWARKIRHQLDAEELKRRVAVLDEGHLLRLTIADYAYRMYERG